MKQKRCFLCLKQGHGVKECTSKGSCYSCKGRHHSSICTGKAKSETKKENDKELLKDEKEVSKTEKETEETQSNCASSNFTVLLQTAQANVYNIDKSKSSNSRLFFDLGSQLSYITPKLREKLGLRTVGKREMSIKTFGGGRQTKVLDIVDFFVQTEDGLIKINAFVSEICYPLRGQNTKFAKENYSHLKNLKLADFNESESVNVDILIGSIYYWDFINGKHIVQGKKGEPVAISSNLGYILNGLP